MSGTVQRVSLRDTEQTTQSDKRPQIQVSFRLMLIVPERGLFGYLEQAGTQDVENWDRSCSAKKLQAIERSNGFDTYAARASAA